MASKLPPAALTSLMTASGGSHPTELSEEISHVSDACTHTMFAPFVLLKTQISITFLCRCGLRCIFRCNTQRIAIWAHLRPQPMNRSVRMIVLIGSIPALKNNHTTKVNSFPTIHCSHCSQHERCET